MAVETDAYGIGEVGGELDEQGAEVRIDHIEVVLVAHHGGTVQPGKGRTRACADLLHNPEAGKFLLRHADVEHPFLGLEAIEPTPGLLVLALPSGKMHDLDPFALGKPMNVGHERLAHRPHQQGRGYQGSAVLSEETDHTAVGLQPRLVGV